MEAVSLQLNRPFETGGLKTLLVHAEDFPAFWPEAKFPFDDAQWREYFLEGERYSYLVYLGDRLIGHVGLAKENSIRYRVVLFYIAPEARGKGMGARVLQLTEHYAHEKFGATEVCLKVQDFNPRAIHLYQKCGFRQFQKDGTTINMEKIP